MFLEGFNRGPGEWAWGGGPLALALLPSPRQSQLKCPPSKSGSTRTDGLPPGNAQVNLRSRGDLWGGEGLAGLL